MSINNTTKMAFQAALAISIAEFMSAWFNFDRGYWITLTAMALTTQTWGESVKRSFERVGMTILGGSIGTLLYFMIRDSSPMLFIALLLVFIFFSVYMFKINHLISVFFLTCFIVFLFALIGQWDLLMLRARILDTAMGAGIALSVGSFCFPLKTNIMNQLSGYLQKMKASLESVFHASQVRTQVSGQALTTEFQHIKQDAFILRYELFFHRLNLNDFYYLIHQIERAKQYLISLIEIYHWLLPHLKEEDNKVIFSAVQTTSDNLDILIQYLDQNHPGKMLPAANLSEMLEQAIYDDPERFASLERDAQGVFSLMYFLTCLNTCLNEAYTIICRL